MLYFFFLLLIFKQQIQHTNIGANVLLVKDEVDEVALTRGMLEGALNQEAIISYLPTINHIIHTHLTTWVAAPSVSLYTTVKNMYMEIILVTFLRVPAHKLQEMSAHSTNSFKGATSIPVSFSLGGLYKSAFTEGLSANKYLREYASDVMTEMMARLEIMERRKVKRDIKRKNNKDTNMKKRKKEEEEEEEEREDIQSCLIGRLALAITKHLHEKKSNNNNNNNNKKKKPLEKERARLIELLLDHMVIFVSGLVPKALSSIVSSTWYSTSL
jgi:cytochrome P450